MYTLFEPLPAKRGTDPVEGGPTWLSSVRDDQVGGIPVITLSEKVLEIWIWNGTRAGSVKLDHVTMTRPVSGSTSISSLSAASNGLPLMISPLGVLAGVTSKGPVQVCPQSVER